MDRKIIITGDGSHSIFVPGLNEHYHSVYGAVQESLHIFIRNGLDRCHANALSILEIGYGTGLNALLTFHKTSETKQSLYYESWEKYPLTADEYERLNYSEMTGTNTYLYKAIIEAPWNAVHEIAPGAVIKKVTGDIREFHSDKYFDLVYFDAFGPNVQPELWTADVFRRISSRQQPGAILVTYSVKGSVTRNLKEAGYQVEKVPGPPGKRQITVASKNTVPNE
ncbi:MAG: tRNA (5-methylaminomethyl-2-thiouridine)(34)-methyltransferase MnmD [Bacteroidota bacterium]